MGRDYHTIIVDWVMPGMDGLETIRCIRREIGDKTPIVLLSAYDWSETVSYTHLIGRFDAGGTMLNPHGLVVWKRLPILGHWETGRWFAWRDDWRWGCTTAMGEGDDYGKVSHLSLIHICFTAWITITPPEMSLPSSTKRTSSSEGW